MYNEYNIFGLDIDTWITENCLICSSTNHIFLNFSNADAWECWNCRSRWWLDELYCREAYMILHNKTEKEAEQDLIEGNLLFLNGQSVRG